MASAQERGLDRAATASASADSRAGGTKNRASKRPSELPTGARKRFEGQTLPPGLRRTRTASAPAPEVEVEPETECTQELLIIDGQLAIKDYNGNILGTP